MRLPPRKKPGDAILATDWNLLLEAVAARTPCPGNGLQLVASSGGFAYSSPPPKGDMPKGQPPFSVIAIEKSGGNYLVTIKEGWVIERQPKTGDHPAVKLWMPRHGATTLDTIPRPQLAMSIDDIAWCRYQTSAAGSLTAAPEIIVAAANQDGAHYYPTDPEASGGNGDFYVKLFKLELDGGSPRVRVYQQSDIGHVAQLWTGENVGGGQRIFKKHDEATNIYQFRSLAGRGTYTGDYPDAGVTGQVKTVTDGDLVRVVGNGRKGSRVWKDCDGNEVFRIEWNDGLITSGGNLYMECGCDGASSNSSNIPV
jgi:hypothetical protein